MSQQSACPVAASSPSRQEPPEAGAGSKGGGFLCLCCSAWPAGRGWGNAWWPWTSPGQQPCTCPLCPSVQVAKLPFTINDGKWHHICVTWTTRDGVWEAYQDGTQGGSGENLAPYHPIKPQGVLVLGQEQVHADSRGGVGTRPDPRAAAPWPRAGEAPAHCGHGQSRVASRALPSRGPRDPRGSSAWGRRPQRHPVLWAHW